MLGLLCALVTNVRAQQPASGQQPRFRSSVEVTSIDVSVVDGQSKPVLNLSPADFTVRIDGKPRAVISAEWVPLAAASDGKPPVRVPEGYSSNENNTGGRLIAIAVDEPHIRPGGAAAVLAAASAFIDRLSPSDRIAAISLAVGGPVTAFIGDREKVKETIGRMPGQRSAIRSPSISVTPAEALDIADGNRLAADLVMARECAGLRPGTVAMQACRQEVESEALQLAEQLRQSSDSTVRALRDILEAMKILNGPKTLILMSEGFTVRDATLTNELGTLAATTRTSIYALKLDNQLFEITSARAPIIEPLGAPGRTDGLEQLASASRGTLFLVNGTGSQLFASIESELSGYYLLGVESDPGDRDDKPHAIRIDVSRRGVTVRTRRQLLNSKGEATQPRSARDAVHASLSAPLLSSALPLRIASFALRGPEQGKVQLLFRAEVGTDYVASRQAVLGYVIQDLAGKSVESRTVSVVLSPVMNGVPGPLQYAGGASVPPGEYTIKLAVTQGDRLGSVEHPIHARLANLGEVSLSDLIAGGPVDSAEVLRPTVGYSINYGTLHGYLEAYGPHLEHVATTYEVATGADSPALLTADVAKRTAGDGRALFTHMIPIGKLPPGEYVLRAKVTSSGEPLKTLTRRFEIAPPAVLMTSAAGVGGPAPSATADLFLPVEDATMSRPFARDHALAPQTLEPFLKRVPASTKSAFDSGVSALRSANYATAVMLFKSAIRPDEDSTAALSYLAASLAAAGQPAEATSVWQTALVDGSDLPQIYEWLADTFVRLKDFTAARSILEEAVERWPADTRFAKALAFSYATLGRGREAIRALDRYIADGHADPDLLFLGVEWIFQVHNNRAVVVNPAVDLAMARKYAEQYAKANGPKQPLVKQWIDFLESEKR